MSLKEECYNLRARTNKYQNKLLLRSAIMAKRLFVSRLSWYITTKAFKGLFSRFGVVTEAKIVTDPETQRPKGFGFVTFQSEDEAQKALKAMDGRMVNGRLIFVEVAKNQSPGPEASS